VRRSAAIAFTGAALAAGCGGGSSDPAAGEGSAAASERSLAQPADTEGLPPALAGVRSQAGQLLDGGPEAFQERIKELDGHPVVVNKWASWCGPCRAEFPFFRSQAEKLRDEVTFLGVNSSDNEADAASFLRELPVPYPSYLDPDLEVADVFNGVAAFPTTAFYDSSGKLTYLKQGGYASEELLAEDIKRHAR
jgi:thiol-disulfide isomerase/thioredoxin